MADILNQDDELSGNQDQYKQTNSGSGPATVGGVGSAQVGASTAGVGKGGTGGYTNIQSYLNANQGDTGSAQNLEKATAPTFDTESNNITKQSNDYVSNAQKQVDDNKITQDKANELIGGASSLYSYGDHQSDDYNNSVKKVQGALTNQYTGPTSYNYAIGADAQNLGGQLKDNGGFDSLMNGVYGKAAGKNLSQGQYQLQKQFDVNNSALQDTRNNLLGKYSGLETQRDQTVTDTTNKLSDVAGQYRQNQSALKDYLYNQANVYDTKQAQAENAAKAAFAQDMTNDRSGLASIGQGAVGEVGQQLRRDNGIWDNNLTMAQLQKEQDVNKSRTYGLWNAGDKVANWDERLNRLNNYYGAENTKYANTGDTEKRSYNAIQDFLNSAAAKKQDGFKVK